MAYLDVACHNLQTAGVAVAAATAAAAAAAALVAVAVVALAFACCRQNTAVVGLACSMVFAC